MIDHASLGVSDLDRSRAFYDAALAPLGFRRVNDLETQAGYGPADEADDFYLVQDAAGAVRPSPASHVAFSARHREAVDDFFAAAIAAGGRDDGSPGLRPQYHASYYAAYVIDPDGNRIEAVCHAPD